MILIRHTKSASIALVLVCVSCAKTNVQVSPVFSSSIAAKPCKDAKDLSRADVFVTKPYSIIMIKPGNIDDKILAKMPDPDATRTPVIRPSLEFVPLHGDQALAKRNKGIGSERLEN